MITKPRYHPGDRIGGRYQVHKALMGGMGEVYLCLDHVTNLPFALKTFPRHYLTDLNMRRIFEAEVLTWVALEDHPNIVRCFTMNFIDNQPFMFLEWIAGEDGKDACLRSQLRLGALDLQPALEFIIDICRGLIHAQEKQPGLIHRDLKPENILISQGRLAKVTDFGLAKVIQVVRETTGLETFAAADSLINETKISGTPPYMAPEQWCNGPLDIRTDIYAVGCILYELLTGQQPYQPLSLKISEQHCFASIPQLPLSQASALDLNEILQCSMAKRKEDRFATAKDLLDALTLVYRKQFTTLPRTFPDKGEFNALDYGNRATAYMRLKRYPEALADFNTLLQLDPMLAKAYCDRGATYVQLERYAEAIADFNYAISLKQNDPLTYTNRGIAYDRMQHYAAAFADYSQAIQIDPKFVPVYLNRAITFLKLHRYDEALADLNPIIQSNPDFAAAHHQRAKTYSGLKQFEDALSDYDRAIKLDPTLPNIYLERGYIQGIQTNYTAAIEDFTAAIKMDPENAQAIQLLGFTFTSLGQNEQALHHYDRAIALDPTHAQTFFQRGRIFEQNERYEEALSDYTSAIKLHSDQPEYYHRRGDTYAKLEKYEDALTDFTSVLQLASPDTSTYISRGNCYTHLGNFQSALVDYQKAIHLEPNCGLAYFNIGVLLANQGQLREALPFLEKAVQLGEPLGSPALTQVRQVLGLESAAKLDPARQAFAAFAEASSLAAMQQAVARFPSLMQSDFIAAVEQLITQRVSSEDRPAFEKRLGWLQQLVRQQK